MALEIWKQNKKFLLSHILNDFRKNKENCCFLGVKVKWYLLTMSSWISAKNWDLNLK